MGVLDRLTVAVTFDPAKGYVATIRTWQRR